MDTTPWFLFTFSLQHFHQSVNKTREGASNQILGPEVKIICLPGGPIGWPQDDPSLEKHVYLPFLPATSSSPSRNLEGLFELTRRPSRALASRFQNHRETRTPSKLWFNLTTCLTLVSSSASQQAAIISSTLSSFERSFKTPPNSQGGGMHVPVADLSPTTAASMPALPQGTTLAFIQTPSVQLYPPPSAQ